MDHLPVHTYSRSNCVEIKKRHLIFSSPLRAIAAFQDSNVAFINFKIGLALAYLHVECARMSASPYRISVDNIGLLLQGVFVMKNHRKDGPTYLNVSCLKESVFCKKVL